MNQSQYLNSQYLNPLLEYLRDRGLITTWMKSKIKTTHSRKADENHVKSPRSFCFVIIGEHNIHYASMLKGLPDPFIVGILLHEIAHMIIAEEQGDPELGVDEWVLENVPEAGYTYKNIRYIDFNDKPRTAKNLECVSKTFLTLIGV